MTAPDPVSEAANAALLAVTRMDFRLAAARSMEVPRAERVASLTRAFQQYRQLLRAFGDLERAAPSAAAAGYLADDRARDFMEANT